MHAHIVLAHPEPKSYNAHLARIARDALEGEGWTTTLSDLYQMGFDPCERASHYASPLDGTRFDVQTEQRHACAEGTLPAVVAAEIDRLDRADLLILQYPMWWHLPPAMLKGWFDRVLVYGDVYTSKQRFENGRFAGKRAMLSLTVGTSAETYAFDGRSGDIELLLWPVNFSLAYVGFSVLKPFVAYGVEAGLRYSEASVVESRLQRQEQDLARTLQRLDRIETVPFNRMADWGGDGRVKPEAPAFSPFIRKKQQLVLE
ncbi:MAG: NAD(P)H-dependent oxidoreductase [Betaproteobacteria bacterium]|nr:NAD(P)H-dependent oxidoreductase [Betaproteobacteria bacterium]MBK8687190.1 NAD(P)H-dependent oxidoreductase [Betaproteobacteria bacterium]MBK9676650.1 NAD(P)H-dependent oxidoreductase [Betaproteobacteria bacterium]